MLGDIGLKWCNSPDVGRHRIELTGPESPMIGFNFNSSNVGRHRIELKSNVKRHWTELFQGKSANANWLSTRTESSGSFLPRINFQKANPKDMWYEPLGWTSAQLHRAKQQRDIQRWLEGDSNKRSKCPNCLVQYKGKTDRQKEKERQSRDSNTGTTVFGTAVLSVTHYIQVTHLLPPPHHDANYTLTLRRLMSYIYGAPILDVSRSHTTTQHSR